MAPFPAPLGSFSQIPRILVGQCIVRLEALRSPPCLPSYLLLAMTLFEVGRADPDVLCRPFGYEKRRLCRLTRSTHTYSSCSTSRSKRALTLAHSRGSVERAGPRSGQVRCVHMPPASHNTREYGLRRRRQRHHRGQYSETCKMARPEWPLDR